MGNDQLAIRQYINLVNGNMDVLTMINDWLDGIGGW